LDANLTYWDVNNRYVGIRTTTPNYPLQVSGNAYIGNVYLLGNTITTDSGVLGLGATSNISITGGSKDYVLTTDGSGNISWANVSSIVSVTGLTGNIITLGSNTAQALISNAVSLTSSTDVTDAIAQLNYVLGKLVPQSPPNFPNSTTITLSTGTTSGLMTNFTQTDNSGWGNLSVTAGTSVSAVRSAVFQTSAVTNVGPGSTGTVSAYVNGAPNGNVALTGSNSNTTNGNIYVYNVEDYHNIVSSVTAGFWTVFSTYAVAAAGVPAGWNRVYIYDSGTGAQTNNVTWYYDSSSTGTPTFSNTSITLTSNSTTYSSTIPHFNSSTVFRIKGNVANLSGDLYSSVPTTSTAGGAFSAPTPPGYANFIPAISTPLSRNLTATQYFETSVSIASGFSFGAGGPTISFSSPYSTGSSGAITPGVTVLYKTGTSNQIEETAITNSYSGASAAYRITNPDAGTASDNPAYTGSEATYNSQTNALLATDATVVGAILKYDVTNYSTGYLPVGPNLSSGRASSQYFTFKWTKAAVSKFNITYTGTLAGLWVALPGVTDPTYASPTNGWLNMATAYAGSGVPGTGTGGNGSTGCSTGGAAVLNSVVTAGSYTCTFGTVSSTSATNNEIYIRVKLTSGQSLTAISIGAPTN
jgi:hypothetical protein